jgi:hypothetical protein
MSGAKALDGELVGAVICELLRQSGRKALNFVYNFWLDDASHRLQNKSF